MTSLQTSATLDVLAPARLGTAGIMRTSLARSVPVAMSALLLCGCSSAAAVLVNPNGQQADSPPSPLAVGSPAVGRRGTTAPTPAIDHRVFVEGNSLTVGASPYLAALLATAGWSVTMDGQVGRDTATGTAIVAEREAGIHGTLVVALGTNDPPDPTLFASRIDMLMESATSLRVIWVTVARSGWDGLDAMLVAALSRWPNLKVIDWRPVIARHPDMLAGDGIHLTEAGYQLRAAFIADAVEAVA